MTLQYLPVVIGQRYPRQELQVVSFYTMGIINIWVICQNLTNLTLKRKNYIVRTIKRQCVHQSVEELQVEDQEC